MAAEIQRFKLSFLNDVVIPLYSGRLTCRRLMRPVDLEQLAVVLYNGTPVKGLAVNSTS